MADFAPATSPLDLPEIARRDNLDHVNQALLEFAGEFSNKATNIDFTRWDKLYPYALVLADENYKQIARFVLPIPPDALQIVSPFAIQVSKTLGGTVEEHAGLPFKLISFSGTTGLYPLKGTARESTTNNNQIFGGTIDAAAQLAAVGDQALYEGTPPIARSSVSQDNADLVGTGYGQFRLLRLFIENYVHNKKAGNQKYRLLFVVYKEQVAYVVTPMTFVVKRDAGRALKYRYDIQFKAWKEVPSETLTQSGPADFIAPKTTLQRVLETLQKAQRVMLATRSVINAFRADVQKVLDIVRQSALVIKLMLNTLKTIVDLPRQLIQDLKGVVLQSWQSIQEEISGQDGLLGRLAKDSSSVQNAKFTSADTKRDWQPDPSVMDKIFSDPYNKDSYDFLSRIDIDKLDLPPALAAKIDEEYTRVQNFTASDYAVMRAEVLLSMISIADAIGASDATYDQTYRNVHATVTRTVNSDDYSILFAINNVLDSLNELSTAQTDPHLNALEYVAGLAESSGIAFKVPTSKFAVPMPYDTTLEELAFKYLGDPDRWMEIAVLNGLREPYIDEVGFTRSLTAIGSLSEITIADASNLRIGQPIWIQSNFIAREKRHIVNITEVASDQFVLTLDGEADLAKFQPTGAAYIQAFLPDTVNSQQVIYIPSDIEVPDNSELAKIPGVDAFDSLLEQGGVDILLTNDNDLAVTNDGDAKMAYGLQAIIQRARVALTTVQGSLIRHPTFGLPIRIGQSIADTDLPTLKEAVRNLFSNDPTFNGVTHVKITQSGGTIALGVGLDVVGQNLPISLSFHLKR